MSSGSRVGVRLETSSTQFQVENFSYICKRFGPLPTHAQPQNLERNIVKSGPILKAGPHSFRIVVAWSLGISGEVQSHSMLGIALERVDTLCSDPTAKFELTLVNKNPAHSISRTDDIQLFTAAAKGWYPRPHAVSREEADGFVLLKSVLDPDKEWLVNDTLTISCTVTLTISGVEPVEENLVEKEQENASLLFSKQMGSLLEAGRFADVVLKVGGEEIQAHRGILATRSPVFEAMLSRWMQEGGQQEIVVKELQPSAVKALLHFMYTSNVDIRPENNEEVISLLEAAHLYQVGSLIQICGAALMSQLTIESVAKTLMLADMADIKHLRKGCLEFITASLERLAEVQMTECYQELVQKQPHLVADILSAVVPPAKKRKISIDLDF